MKQQEVNLSQVEKIAAEGTKTIAAGSTKHGNDNVEPMDAPSQLQLLARRDQSVFKVILSHLDKFWLLKSVQLVSRNFYVVVPDMIEAIEPMFIASNSTASAPSVLHKQTTQQNKTCGREVLKMVPLSLATRCAYLCVINFCNQRELDGAQLSRALARSGDRLEALNLSQCLALTRCVT